MLLSKITAFFDGLFSSMGASIGNLIAEGDKDKLLKVFFELMSLRYFVAGLCSITLYFAVPKLITVWLGEKYILPQLVLILMSIHIFILQARLTVTNFKDAYGLFQDVWAPIAEVLISVSLSLILGKFYGLPGILFAFTMADLLVKICWQPYYLFKKGFHVSVVREYVPVFLRYMILLAIAMGGIIYLERKVGALINATSFVGAFAYCLLIGGMVLFLLMILFMCFDKNFRYFIIHIRGYIKNK